MLFCSVSIIIVPGRVALGYIGWAVGEVMRKLGADVGFEVKGR